MKQISCKECGVEFIIDATPESALEAKVIQVGTDYNNDTYCPVCVKRLLKEMICKQSKR